MEVMSLKVTLDKAGRVVLPKSLRDELHLGAGDTLELTVRGEEVTMRPKRSAPPLQRERGVWVYRTGKPVTAEEIRLAIEQTRTERDRP